MGKYLRLTCVFAIALSLAACQSQRESYDNAFVTCSISGMYEGSYAHDRCTQRIYDENRRKSDQAAATVAAGSRLPLSELMHSQSTMSVRKIASGQDGTVVGIVDVSINFGGRQKQKPLANAGGSVHPIWFRSK